MIHGLDHAALVAFVTPIVGDEAEDVVQETYIRMLTTTAEFRGESAKMTWACAIARRIALDVLRAKGRTPMIESLDAGEPDVSTRAASSADGLDKAIDIRRRLATLTDEERQLVPEAGQPLRVIAANLGWTKDRVAKVLASVRQKLEDLR